MKKREYSTKFPNCPSYFSKKPAERPSLGSSDAREKISARRLNRKWSGKLEAKNGRSIYDTCSFLNKLHFVGLTALDCKIAVSRIKIDYDSMSSKPYSEIQFSNFWWFKL